MWPYKPLLYIEVPKSWAMVLQVISVLLALLGWCTPSVNQDNTEDTTLLKNSGQEKKTLKAQENILARDIHLLTLAIQ